MPPRLVKEKSTFSQQATVTLSKGGTQHPVLSYLMCKSLKKDTP